MKDIENEFIEVFGLNKINSNIYNKYTINTVHGSYSVWFDYDGLFSIFGRFEYARAVNDDMLSKPINPYSGKLNYHGYECNGFIFDMMRLAASC